MRVVSSGASQAFHKQDTPEWVNQVGLSRKHIFDAVDASVRRLGTYIDVLQIHRLDRNVPREEIMKALNDVVESGKVSYIGAWVRLFIWYFLIITC
jgi:aryl-alcohol dehydrogenase-like predicted oxidoreductase